MSQQLTVSVDASRDHPDMTVQDVFTHVLDLFQLVSQSDFSAQNDIIWRLVSVRMNSPFTVTAEAVARRQGVPIDELALRQKTAFANNYRALKAGRIASEWAAPKTREIASRILARNRNGIGSTTVNVRIDPNEAPIVITREDADLAATATEYLFPQLRKTKEQYGSVEGRLVLIQRHYGKPAIQILERKTKEEIWCVVPDEFQHQISESTSVEDVWRGSRVIVRGKITYGTDGKIARVVASDIRRIEPKEIQEEAIADTSFTGGLSVAEYLEKFRGGDLG